jgi:hypothetical protein
MAVLGTDLFPVIPDDYLSKLGSPPAGNQWPCRAARPTAWKLSWSPVNNSVLSSGRRFRFRLRRTERQVKLRGSVTNRRPERTLHRISEELAKPSA